MANVEHSSLTGSALHEPKGTATASSGSAYIANGSGSGTFTIADGSITLEWIDGSGSSPATGNRLLANNSVATLRKKSSTVWQIWGNGIS